VRHAGPDALASLEPLLARLRGLDGLTEPRPAKFSRRSQAFLHFHEDPTGMYADVKVGGEWERFPVSSARDQRAFLSAVRAALESP
jgi:hypothetical protein